MLLIKTASLKAGYILKTATENHPEPVNGFTLMELVVVMALITVMFFFSIPKVHYSLMSPERDISRTMIQTVKQLRENALSEQKQYTLHLDIIKGTTWISHEFMTYTQREEAAKAGNRLPGNLRILKIEFPLKNQIKHDRADIHFFSRGYSDKAIIYFEKSYSEKFALLVEPFLDKVRFLETGSL